MDGHAIFDFCKKILFGNSVLSAVIRAIVALLLSVAVFPYGVLTVTALWSVLLPKTPLLPPDLGGNTEDSLSFFRLLRNIIFVCLLGFVILSLFCSVLDEQVLNKIADFVRLIAAYSIFPNQLFERMENTSAMIANDDLAVIRSMFISLFCPVLLAVRMHNLERGVRVLAGVSIFVKKVNIPYGLASFAALMCLLVPSMYFVFNDSIWATAGLIPRIYWLSGPILFSAIIGCSEIVGCISLWIAIVIVLHSHRDKNRT